VVAEIDWRQYVQFYSQFQGSDGTMKATGMDSLIIQFSGEYDLSCKEQLRAELDGLSQGRNLILDLSRVTYLDSTFISALVTIYKSRAESGHECETLIIQNQTVQRLFDVLGLHKVLKIVDSMDAAMGNTSQSPKIREAFPGVAYLAAQSSGPTFRSEERFTDTG
jgi:anti-sigma B factor antagonist